VEKRAKILDVFANYRAVELCSRYPPDDAEVEGEGERNRLKFSKIIKLVNGNTMPF
jgi:hypothetical protein